MSADTVRDRLERVTEQIDAACDTLLPNRAADAERDRIARRVLWDELRAARTQLAAAERLLRAGWGPGCEFRSQAEYNAAVDALLTALASQGDKP